MLVEPKGNEMQVTFDDVDSFLSECDVESERIDGKIVRCDIAEMQANEGVYDIFVKAGIAVRGQLRQLVHHCGKAYLGDDPHGDAENIAHETVKKIYDRCEQLNLNVRSGVFE